MKAIDTIRTKKKRANVNSIYKELCRNQVSNIDEKTMASFVSEIIKSNEIVNKKTNYGDSSGKVINKVDKQVTTVLAKIDHNEIHNEIDLTPSIDRNICTPANESSKSRNNTNQNDLQTEDKNISEVTSLLNNTVCTPMISNKKNVSRKEDKQIKSIEAELAAVKSHLKCQIANINIKIESMSNSYVTSLNSFNVNDQLITTSTF